MKRKMKRGAFKALVIGLAFTFLSTTTPISAVASAAQTRPQLSMDEILEQYHSQINDAQMIADSKSSGFSERSNSDLESVKTAAKAQAISSLISAGYEAYDVNPSSFHAVEDALQTDLEGMGLSPEYSYIAVVGDGSNSQTRGAGSSFTYPYDGKIYVLRYLTIAAADDPRYHQISNGVSLVKSSNISFLQNCLDTVIYALAGQATTIGGVNVGSVIGTIASLCGLSTSMLSPAGTTSLVMNAATDWTRMYTQVYRSSSGFWYSGSCVEYVDRKSSVDGYYFSAQTNTSVRVDTNNDNRRQYSSKYSDVTWRHQYAVLGDIAGVVVYDPGSFPYSRFYFGDSVIITHNAYF